MTQLPELDSAVVRANSVLGRSESVMDHVESLYRDLHEHPELSGYEEHTAAKVAERLVGAGYEVHRHLGGHGVLGILRNGDGPTVALRADMDALPIREETGFPFASTVEFTTDSGETVPVMHACGHDLHTSALVGAALALAESQGAWSGTVVVIGQPAEETMEGAAGMLADGIFTEFVRPDVVIGQHCTPTRVGMLHHRSGPVYSACKNFRIRLHGKGGHGAAPHWAIDPVLLAARVIVDLHSIPSRDIAPDQMAVVTVGSVHGGTRPNVIPEFVVLELTARAHADDVMDVIEAAIRRIAEGASRAAGSPRPAEVELIESTFATVNDETVSNRLEDMHAALFPAEDIVPFPVVNSGSEDFAFYGTPGPGRYDGDPIPTAMWFFGTTNPDRWEDTAGSLIERIGQVPVQHTPFYAPDVEPTLDRATKAMIAGAIGFLAEPA